MNSQTIPKSAVHTTKNKFWITLAVVALLLVLAIGLFLVSTVRVISISGRGEQYVLKPNQIRLGVLFIDEGAAAIFREKSHWIGPIISTEGMLTIENDVTITGPVVLFSSGLQLGENATVRGSVYLFSGGLTLKQGASVRHNAVLFAGGVNLGQESSIGGDVVSFAGPVALQEKASLRGDTVMFAGVMKIGREAIAYGKLISFSGGLELAPNAILRDDAVLFFGNIHLSPDAQIRGDVIVTEGDATLDDQSTIYGKLYLNPASKTGRGRLYKSSEAQITRDVIKPVNIESVAGWRIGRMVLGKILKIILLIVAVICLLMALMFYLGRRTRVHKEKEEVRAHNPEESPQPMTPSLRL